MRALDGLNARTHLAIYPIVFPIFFSQLRNNIRDNVEQVKAREAKGSLAEDGVPELQRDNKLENKQIKVILAPSCILAIERGQHAYLLCFVLLLMTWMTIMITWDCPQPRSTRRPPPSSSPLAQCTRYGSARLMTSSQVQCHSVGLCCLNQFPQCSA
jgi:hypothetical protein